jgi:hypothetical protein
MNDLGQQLQRLALLPDGGDASDGELLQNSLKEATQSTSNMKTCMSLARPLRNSIGMSAL